MKVDDLFSNEAELWVLGSICLKPDVIAKVLCILPELDYFFIPEHRLIYETMLLIYIDRRPIDEVTLRAELKQKGYFEKIGGEEKFQEIFKGVPTAWNAEHYAKIIREKYKYRKVISAIEEMNKIPTENIPVDEQVEQIQSLALSLEHGTKETEYNSFTDAEEIERELKIQKPYIPTDFRDIDRFIGGFCPGELVIIAARPRVGKSALALNITINQARNGLSCIYFSFEMSFRSLVERALKQYQAKNLAKLNIIVNEKANSPDQLFAFIRKYKQIKKVDFIIVDYLQLMSSGTKNENRTQEVSLISRKLKTIAMSENIPVLALSQLNRECESRENHRPRLSDLRESGSIEQDADIIMLLHREELYALQLDPKAPKDGRTEINIAKNRRGPQGIATLVFIDEKVSFGDYSNTGD